MLFVGPRQCGKTTLAREFVREDSASCFDLEDPMVSLSAWGQTYIQRGGVVSFESTGPGVLFGVLDPTVKKWYVPQELYADYR